MKNRDMCASFFFFFLSNVAGYLGTNSGFLNAVFCDMSFFQHASNIEKKIQNVDFGDQILESRGLSNAKTFQRDLHDPESHSLKIIFMSNIFSSDKLWDGVAAICQKHVPDYIWLTTETLSGLLKKKSQYSFPIAPYLLTCGEVAFFPCWAKWRVSLSIAVFILTWFSS